MRIRKQDGFSILEVLVVLTVIAILVSIVIPMMQDALRRSHIRAGASNARTLFTAYKQYRLDYNFYPATTALDDFEPLRSTGYYRTGGFAVGLQGGQADAYGSPDDMGLNQEFWLEMTLDYDTTVRLLICDSDDAPLAGGDAYDGIYVFENGTLLPL
jgi:prepilin-type N-terminal cleavage/methylation domain-containing protein